MSMTSRQETIVAAYEAAIAKHGSDIEPDVMRAAIQAAVPGASEREMVAALWRAVEQKCQEAGQLEACEAFRQQVKANG